MMFMFPASFAFFFVSLGGIYLSLCSGDVVFLWLSIEISSLGFVGFVATNTIKFYAESLANYYLPNSASNLIFLILVLWFGGSGSGDIVYAILAVFPLLTKLGIPPLHFWLPNTVRNLSWLEVFMLLGPQKLGPLHGLVWSAPLSWEFIIWGVFSAYWGALGGMNQARFNNMMAYSSINVIGWILSVSVVDMWIPYVSWVLYSLTLLGAMASVNNDQQIILGRNPSLAMFLVLIGGWPGGSMFTVKWLTLTSLLSEEVFFPSLYLALSSTFAIPMYLNFIFSSFMHPGMRTEFVFIPPKWFAFWLASTYYWVPCFVY